MKTKNIKQKKNSNDRKSFKALRLKLINSYKIFYRFDNFQSIKKLYL